MLSDDAVHVWRASLDVPAPRLAQLAETLADDEQGRADRFRAPKDRRHYIAARGMLRTLLSRYLDRPPQTLHFHYNDYGKPALADDDEAAPLSFNVSHSGGLVLYALTCGRKVGVDLEWARPLKNVEEIAQRFFSPREIDVLCSLPVRLRQEAFYTCWTRKEAYIKARGHGLFLALDAFDVSLRPGEAAALLATRGDLHEATRWSLHALHPGEGYIGALAVEGSVKSLVCRQWPDEHA